MLKVEFVNIIFRDNIKPGGRSAGLFCCLLATSVFIASIIIDNCKSFTRKLNLKVNVNKFHQVEIVKTAMNDFFHNA